MCLNTELLNVISEPAIFIEKNYRITIVNKAFNEYFVAENRDYINANLSDLVGEKCFKEKIKTHIDNCLLGKNVENNIKVDFNKTGSKHLAINYYPHYQDNKIKGAILKMKEAALASTPQNDWHDTINAIDDAFFVVDNDYIVKDINKYGLKLYRKSRNEVVGEKCYKVFHGLDKPIEGCPLCRSIQTKKTEIIEYYEKELNKWISLKSSPIYDEKGINYKHVHIVRDITEFKQLEQSQDWVNEELVLAQESALEKDRKFRAYVDQSPVAIYVTNTKGDCIYANKKWLTIAGMELDEALLDGWVNALHPDDAKTISEGWYKSVETNGRWLYEYRFVNKKGEITWVESSAKAIYNTENEIVGYLGTNIDITERKQTESVLRKNRKETEIKKRIAERFVQAADEEIFISVLKIILEYIKCDFGYFGYIDKSGDLVCPSMTYDIMDICKVDQKTIVFPQEKWGGIWGESLKLKRTVYKNSGLGVPKGHIPLKNALACVILNKDKLIGQIVLGNKENEFQNTDVTFLEDLCNYISPLLASILSEFEYKAALLQAKNRAEEHKIQIDRKNRKIKQSNKRLEGLLSLAQFQTNSIQEFLDYALNKAIELTDSKIGYIYFYNETSRKFILNTWSKEVMKECKVVDPQTEYDLDKTDVWGEAVRQRRPIVINDYLADNPQKKGTPEGHVKLRKFLTIPVFFEGKIVAVCGVANKEEDYDKEDILQLKLLMDGVWKNTERIKMIENLQATKDKAEENEHKFRSLFNTVDDAIFIFNKDNYKIIEANKATSDLYGYSNDELIGMSCLKFSAEVKDSVAVTEKMLKEGKAKVNVRHHKKKNGEDIFVELQAYNISVDNEDLTFSVCKDITEQMKYEKEILFAKERAEESEKKFKRAFDYAGIGICLVSLEGRWMKVNNSLCEILGYSSNELLKLTFQDITHPDDLDLDLQNVKRLIEGRANAYTMEKRYFHKNGNVIWVQLDVAIVLNNSQKPLYFISQIQDISKGKQYQIELVKSKEELEKSEKQFRKLFENMEQGFALHKMHYDENGKPVDYEFVLLNKSFEKFTKSKASDYIGKTIKELLPNTEQLWIDNFGKVAKTGEPLHFENYAQEFNKYYDVVAYSPQKDYFATIFTDVTKNKVYEKELEEHRNNLEHLVKERTDELETSNEELKAINEELYEQREELKTALTKLKKTQQQLVHSEKMASLGVLIAGVAHEINNPINFISGSIIGLRESYPYFKELINLYTKLRDNYDESIIAKIKEEEQNVSLELLEEILNLSIKNIGKGVERSTKIVKGLLSFTQANSKDKIKYDIHSNLEDTLTILYNQYKKRVQIIKNYEDLPKIKCYVTQVNQIWMNILINAIQSIKEKGVITISTNVINNTKVCVSIKDTGIGMTDSVIARIYDPFFTTKPVGQGTGLGMSIVYNYIKNNKGEIHVKSQPGKGTEFKIYLPIDDEG